MKGALRAKHDLLNHENENIRAAADEIYQQYLKMSDSHRRNRYVWQNHLVVYSISAGDIITIPEEGDTITNGRQ